MDKRLEQAFHKRGCPNGKRHMGGCSTSSGKHKSKPRQDTLPAYQNGFGWKRCKTPSVGECQDSHTFAGSVNWLRKFRKLVRSTKDETCKTLWPSNSTARGINPRFRCTYVHQKTRTRMSLQHYLLWSKTGNDPMPINHLADNSMVGCSYSRGHPATSMSRLQPPNNADES